MTVVVVTRIIVITDFFHASPVPSTHPVDVYRLTILVNFDVHPNSRARA